MQNPFLPDAPDADELNAGQGPALAPENAATPLSLKLVGKKIPLRFCEFKISNTVTKMHASDALGISALGVLLQSPVAFGPGTLMRVWVEMPDYWARKSRHVGYRHTDAPTYFQILARVVNCEEAGKRGNKFQILCQNLNLDPVDELVLNDYLGVGPDL